MKEKRKLDLSPHSQEEDDEINAAIASDPDTWVPTDEEWAKFRPWRDDHPEVAYGVKPKFAEELIERLKKTEPETAKRLAKYNREVEEAERKYQAMLEAQAAEGGAKANTG